MRLLDRDSTLLITIGAIAVTAWICFRLYTGMTLEDALITYRYATNLASGNGFTFNPGEQVQGTTTPLLTLVLGLSGWLLGPGRIPITSNILMIAAALGAGLFTFWGLSALNISRQLSGFVTCVLCLSPVTMWTTAGGMETPLVICFMAIGFWAIARERFSVAATVCALLVLTRIDGCFWAAGIYLLILIRDRRAFFWAIVVGLLIVSPWFLFSNHYFGSLLPHTMSAKQIIGAEPSLDPANLISEARWYAQSFGASAPFFKPFGLLLFVAGVAIPVWRSKIPVLVWLVLFPFVFEFVFFIGDAPNFAWYFVPVAWSALVLGILGLREVWQWFGSRAKLNSRPVTLVFALLYIAATIWASVSAAGYHRAYQANEEGTRKLVGLWLKENTPHDAVIAMEAIGYQGYYSERRVIDLAGLVSPSVVEISKHHTSNADLFAEICTRLKPDYIVLRSYEYEENRHFHGGNLFDDDQQKEQFDQAYRPVKEFIAPVPEVWRKLSRVMVFQRNPEELAG